MATNLNIKNNIIAEKISKILKIFNLEFIFSFLLNFSENKGISNTKRIGIINAISKRNWILVNIGNWLKFMWGIEAISIASAGVGNPINEFFWLLSILKFANR